MSENRVICVDFGGSKCDITPLDSHFSPAMMPEYTKIDIPSSQKGQISALFQQIPTMMAGEALSNSYILKWHDGLPHELVKFHDHGGYMAVARDPATGRFTQFAEVYPGVDRAAIAYGFTAMSLVTGHYFLSEINSQMRVMNQSIDRILEFLYGDKKAELLSEISFARYAHQNFASIMGHEDQRRATIQSLQEAKKTAMKDIEFYLGDLETAVTSKKESDVESLVNRAFRIKECLELSIQLYVSSNVLEVFYAENYDPEYLRYVETDSVAYISKCEKQELGDFAVLREKVNAANQPKIGKKIDKEGLLRSINRTIDELSKDVKPEIEQGLHHALHAVERPAECCISADGSVYLKRA